MNTNRKTATIVGVLFIIGTAAGVLSAVVTGPFLTGSDYLISIAANETRWVLGTLLVLLMGFPLAMVPVMLYPIFRKHNEVLALGAVLFRGILEAVSYMVLVISMLLLLTVSQEYVKTVISDASFYQTLGALLVEAGDWINQILAIVFSIGAIIIYYLFYRLRLIPRWLSVWGLVGSVVYFAAPFISMLSVQHLPLSLNSPLGFLLGPLAVQEMVFAVWLIVKGFNPPALTSQSMSVKSS